MYKPQDHYFKKAKKEGYPARSVYKLKEIDEKLAQLDIQRKQSIPAIDKKILSQYERILVNRDGLAIVSVKNNTCSGCNMFMPAQVINLIRMYEKIMVCDVCNRILFIGDE